MGGQAESLTSEVRENYQPGLAAGRCPRRSPCAPSGPAAPTARPRTLPAGQLEVAVLDRTRANRKFKRIAGAALAALLPVAGGRRAPAAAPAPADTPPHDANGASRSDESDDGR